MKKRIAKKVLRYAEHYSLRNVLTACRRLNVDVADLAEILPLSKKAAKKRRIVMGIDMAVEGTTDYTAIAVYNVDATETGRFSTATLNESAKPKTAFNHRTGQAPTTPGAILTTTRRDLDEMSLVELRETAHNMGLIGYKSLKKADLVARIKEG